MSVLTELGQRGGFLSYFGNIAILWGGIRGAMNLTDKLINFLDIAERSLFQRFFFGYLNLLYLFFMIFLFNYHTDIYAFSFTKLICTIHSIVNIAVFRNY